MTFFRVTRLWKDEQDRNYSEFKDFGSFADAKAHANHLAPKEGEVWIEQRGKGSRPILTDRKGEDEPMTREHLTQLQEQVRRLVHKTKLPKESA